MNAHEDIRIGTLVLAHDRTTEVIRQLLPYGFETFQISVRSSELCTITNRYFCILNDVGNWIAASSSFVSSEALSRWVGSKAFTDRGLLMASNVSM